MDNKILFEEKNGSLRFFNAEFDIYGIVPDEIVKEGENSIIHYVNSTVESVKRRKSLEDQIRTKNIPISVQHGEKTLSGRIAKATPHYLYVELDEPIKARGELNAGFMGRGFFDENHEKVSEHGYEAASDMLIRAYEKNLAQNGIRNLAQKLNQP